MGRIEEWFEVYVWEVDQETIKFANKKSKMILRLVYLSFYRDLNKIERFVSKSEEYITVGDVIRWSEYLTRPRVKREYHK